MDSNHDKQIQNLLCYRYTTRQLDPLKHWLYGLFPKCFPKETLKTALRVASKGSGSCTFRSHSSTSITPIAGRCSLRGSRLDRKEIPALNIKRLRHIIGTPLDLKQSCHPL
jgi:hypothetical protein